MEINLNVIRAMFHSLAAGEKIYKFSELRDLLAKENIDVSNFNLRRKADQQALLSVAEKYIYDSERNDEPESQSQYPDIPFIYAWQLEGVDGSKDCFLHPTTPLTCDVLSGQYCELVVSNKGCSQAVTGQKQTVDEPSLFPANHGEKFSIQSNRSKPTVPNKGINEIKPIQVKGALPNLLIDNWLLAENYLRYSTERDDGDYTDLPMVINLVVASIANRKQSKISRREAVGLLQQLCQFFNDIGQLENLSEALRQDDELYRVLCKDMLSEARRQALTNPFELPDFIRECTEVKSIGQLPTPPFG